MADEFEILFPEREVTLSTGERISVNEYGMRDGLRVDAFAGPMIADLHALLSQKLDDNTVLIELNAVFGRHEDIVMRAIAIATDRPVDWVDALSDPDGLKLRMTWWGVNSSFFTNRLVQIGQAKLSHLLKSLLGSDDMAAAGKN